MKRYLDERIAADLQRKMVLVTGPRQVGKTTMCRHLMPSFPAAQYLNWDVAGDRAILTRQSWSARASLLVIDEIHKMRDWKNWLKGVVDGRPPQQALLVTGSARMETWRQSGDSLAGRYLAFRLHPISVREWCEQQGATPAVALRRLLERGGFPEPCLAEDPEDADRWRRQYFTDLIREDVLEFSRVHEINSMRLLVELLRERVGSPLSLASLARDLALSPTTLKRYLDILQALYIVFSVPPWRHNVARAILQAPKVYFFDTALVRGDPGVRFENAVAAMLLKHVHFLQDARGKAVELHYLRTKDGAEVDFALSSDRQLTHLVECKISDTAIHRPLAAFAGRFPSSEAIQLVQDLRQEEYRAGVRLTDAADWLVGLDA
jgi:predicted AAA+ superfamily ATPase